ncbi:MAG: helix-turn-helix domain-containing protein [Candidatus Hermodarchaeota archaeon]
MSKENEIIELLQNFGLTSNQAQVYLALLKAGTKGSIVRELDHALDIKRTNIYPILNDLIELGCVKEGGRAEKSKNASIFIAIDPIKFIDHLIQKKQLEITTLNEIKKTHSTLLQNIFKKGFEIKLNEIDASLKPYFKPLIDSGWRIQSYVERKELTMFNYQVYDCLLYAPHARFLKDCSFHLFLFDYDIEKDKNALVFFTQGLKRKTKEMKSYFFDIKQFQLIDDEFQAFNNKFHCFKMRVKVKDLENSDYFTKVSQDSTKKEVRNIYYEIGKAIIIPIKEKIFYLWAESDEILYEMIKPVFKTENI